MIIFITIAAFVATFLGGMFALRLQDRLHLILGFSAGAILSVAFFDLLPEALELTEGLYSASTVLTITVIGFALYLMIDRFALLHDHQHGDDGKTPSKGVFGAGSLSVHSFLDGIAVGLAFQVSVAVGLVVAVAVLAHDFSDGINTVGYILRSGGTRKQALRWLTVDALAPALGVLATLFFSVPEQKLGLLLALFSGFFIYIGASDLIPESHHKHPTHFTTIATIVGMATLYLVIQVAGV